MDDLSTLSDRYADVVIALFSSFSFAFAPELLMAEIGRVLRPGGHAYLSALSRRSPSRAIRRAVREGRYRTRGDDRPDSGAPVRLVEIPEIHRLAAVSGLETVEITGLNTLSGVAEFPPLWGIGRLATKLAPASAHTIEIHLRKVGP